MSSKNSNQINVTEARAAMDKFKMEAASEVEVPAPSERFQKTRPQILLKTDEFTHDPGEGGRPAALPPLSASAETNFRRTPLEGGGGPGNSFRSVRRKGGPFSPCYQGGSMVYLVSNMNRVVFASWRGLRPGREHAIQRETSSRGRRQREAGPSLRRSAGSRHERRVSPWADYLTICGN